jgi:hypothetical protein
LHMYPPNPLSYVGVYDHILFFISPQALSFYYPY